MAVKSNKNEQVKDIETKETEVDVEKIKAELMKSMKAEMKEQLKKEVQAELEKEIKENQKQIKVREKVDLNRLVSVRSVVTGSLTVKTKLEEYGYSGYGDIQEISIGELKSLKSSNPRYFTVPMFIIDDEEASKICGMTELYKKISYVDDLVSFFNSNTEETIIKVLSESPKYIRTEVGNKVRDMWNSKEYRDADVALLVERVLGIDVIKQ